VDTLSATIAVYDRHAANHAARFANTDTPTRRAFIAAVRPGGTVADIGCGGGRDLTAFHAAGLTAIGVDLSTAMLAHAATAAPRAVLIHADARHLPLTDASVDGWWSSAGLVHLDADGVAAAFADAVRTTRPGSPLVCTLRARLDDQDPTGWEPSPFGDRWYARWEPDTVAALWNAAGADRVAVTVEPDTTRPGISWVTATATR
jgi:ubiquinone/menaquinone biosynthesis C-methylase UbiE